MFDSTIVRAHVSAAGANVWPAPSASGFFSSGFSICENVYGFSARLLAKMEIRAS
jgi:hypothetical protein